jgi:hypothetical protein
MGEGGMRRPGTVTVGAASIGVGLVVNLATETIEVKTPWWPWAVWATVGVLVLVAYHSERTGTRQARVSTVDPAVMVGRAAEDLAEVVARQWRGEVNARGLGHVDPIRIRWSATSRPVTPAPVDLLDGRHRPAPPVKVTGLRLSGDLPGMTRMLAGLPVRQLVVIGSPGAGKSTLVMLLTLALLRRRQTGDPVPVLLTVSSWDPDREHFDTWLVRRLGELYPALGGRGRYGTDTVVRLVDRGLIMPVLDGLDELPEPVQARAVTKVTEAVGRDRPLILTSRAVEYQAAVTQAGSPLARAAVVEIEPVSAADAADYLTAGQIDGEARWRPVLDHLAAHPEGALARTLATPLMVYLARTAYQHPDADPATLLAFTDPDSVERHLLDAYLPAVYTLRTRPPHTPTVAPAYTVQQARRWLGFLADHLTREQTTDLAWWRLHHATPRFRLVYGFAFGLVSGLAVGLVSGLAFGLTFGLVFGLAFGLPFGQVDTPQQMRINAKQLVTGLAVGLAAGLTAGLTVGLTAGLTVGLGVGLAFGLGVGLTFVLLFGLGAPATLTKAVTPTSTLKNDRNVSLVVGCGGLAFGLAFGLASGLVGGLAFGLTAWLVFMAGAGSWFRFVMARAVLAARAQLPVNLMPFLDDAYRLGVLRRVGAVYQFRHARLQHHLAALYSTASSDSPSTRPPDSGPAAQPATSAS